VIDPIDGTSNYVRHVPIWASLVALMDGDDVVFRTDHGMKLDEGPRAPACFEIDAFARADRAGWSVVVTGRLEEVTAYDADRLHRLATLGVDPWAEGERRHWMRLVATNITGRRIGA